VKKALLISSVFVVVLVAAVLVSVPRIKNPFKPQLPDKGRVAGTEAVAPAQSAASKDNFAAMLAKAEILEKQGELLPAKEALKNILAAYTADPRIEQAEKDLEDVNSKVLFSAISVPGETATYTVKEGDYLAKIAKEFNTTIDFIKRQNGLSSDVVRPGMPLRIWTGKFSIAVDKSQNLLTLKSNGEVVKTYHVATGKDNITPVGTFKIVNKLVNPDWTHDGKVIAFGTPENILGTRWLGFNVPGYGIHGTSQPESIGKQATAGCVRMLNNEVEELYSLLPVGTEVTIVD